MEFTRADFKGMLQKNGLKATNQRLVILEILAKNKTHPSAYMIRDMLNDMGISMSFATVYNTLESLYECGLIAKVKDENELMRFDFETAFHIHIHDQETYDITDYHDEKFCTMIEKYIRQNVLQKEDIASIELNIKLKKHAIME